MFEKLFFGNTNVHFYVRKTSMHFLNNEELISLVLNSVRRCTFTNMHLIIIINRHITH